MLTSIRLHIVATLKYVAIFYSVPFYFQMDKTSRSFNQSQVELEALYLIIL